MTENERNYVVPLRQYWRMAARYKRAKRAVNGLRKFVIRHMKVKEVKIGKELNELILSRGQRKPPARVQVTIVKDGDVGKVNIIGIPYSKELTLEKGKKVAEKKKEEIKEAKEEENKEILKDHSHEHEGHEHKEEVKGKKYKVKKTARNEKKSQ